MTVNQILSRKGNAVYSVVSTITVYEAIKTMGEKNIGAILVIEDGILKGVMSERDYARKIVLKDKASKDTLVKEIMEEKVITVKPTDNLDYCMELMTTRRVRHLPVMDEDLVLGIISIGDVVMAIIELQKNTIEHLDSYISGSKA
ncbi:CBS domain-containing protein [Flavobacterium granuli]|uniref:CBS domain protein n=1 Tax=Flavobacterium granuli TaxID=280093 RepID=A0A1M5MQH6_9FLAO|nr:CBS domain-containing protein [Flavobacterium granuli]PRZ25021.1 CBS domain protein [Flavobacterium granuli]SHG79033.1 CBS domain-containing protein [Flavobacterium granuli]